MLTREYRINMAAYGIDRWRYEELKARCKQYPDKRLEAAMDHLIHAIHDNDENAISDDLYAVCQRAELAASEAIQVAAVVVKALMSKGEWQNRDHPDGRPGAGEAV